MKDMREDYSEAQSGERQSLGSARNQRVSELAKFQAFYDLAVAMTANRSLDENLTLVVTKAVELLNGDASYIALRDDEDRSVYMHTVFGTRTEGFKNIRIPFGAGIGGRIATTGEPYIVEDYFEETEPLLHDIVRAEGLVSGVAVPIQIEGRNLGVLYVFNRTRSSFTQSDVNTLSLLGNLAAVEITRNQTKAQLQQARDELEDRVRLRTAQLQESKRLLRVETVLRESLEEKTRELKDANERLLREICERRKIEDALSENQEKFRRLYVESVRAQELYRSLLDSCADAIVVYDMDGRVKYVSDSFTAMFGWTLEELVGKRIDYVPESEVEITRERIDEVIEKGIPGSGFESKRLAKDGRVIDASLSASRYHDHNGKPAGLLVILRDITARKRAELAIAQSERQLRLLSAQLLKAQENERKRVARELHDGIGQLLTAIKYRLECLNTHAGDKTAVSPNSSLGSIMGAIHDAIEEVRRISMGLRPSILDDLGIIATMNWFCREFSLTYSSVGIQKKIDVDEALVPKSLKTVIFRIFQEALNNVAKHSNANLVSIELTHDQRRIYLKITDNGVGFHCNPFSSPETCNTGFGLASIRERAESLGGDLRVDSTPGHGTSINASWTLKKILE